LYLNARKFTAVLEYKRLVYADDVNLLRDNIDTKNKITETSIDAGKEVSLKENVEKTKCMLKDTPIEFLSERSGIEPLVGTPTKQFSSIRHSYGDLSASQSALLLAAPTPHSSAPG
jgi:hypothetical protein